MNSLAMLFLQKGGSRHPAAAASWEACVDVWPGNSSPVPAHGPEEAPWGTGLRLMEASELKRIIKGTLGGIKRVLEKITGNLKKKP